MSSFRRRPIVKGRGSLILTAALVAGFAALALAHPHFNKTITVKLPSGVEATIAYNTTPANETHAQNAEVGAFVTPRQPKLTLAAELKVGSVALPAGTYVIGAIKNGADDWTMALYPGQIARGEKPDMSKMIKLDSMYSSAEGNAEHMLIDVTPGHGKFEGKAVLTLHFGSLFLAGALS
jgi:hypothetical protein